MPVPVSQKSRPCIAARQSSSLMQAPRQSFPAQPCKQVIVTTGAQAPSPSQPPACVLMPLVQLCGRQLVEGPG
jgi:hypothetical protein